MSMNKTVCMALLLFLSGASVFCSGKKKPRVFSFGKEQKDLSAIFFEWKPKNPGVPVDLSKQPVLNPLAPTTIPNQWKKHVKSDGSVCFALKENNFHKK